MGGILDIYASSDGLSFSKNAGLLGEQDYEHLIEYFANKKLRNELANLISEATKKKNALRYAGQK